MLFKLNVFFNPKVLYFIRLGRKSSLGGAANPVLIAKFKLLLLELLTPCPRTDGWMDGGAGQLQFLLEVQHPPVLFFGWRTLPQWDFSKVKGLTPGQLCSEVEGRSGQKDIGTPGLGKMSTFFQK